MNEWKLQDFLIEYPPIESENFQTLISAKKEFNELASDFNEPKPEKGDPYNHQLFFKRYMSNYDEMLIMDEPGTGKTCEMTFLTEYVLDQHLKLKSNNINNINVSHIKKTVVLVKSKNLIKEYRNQIIHACTKSRYDIDYIMKMQDKNVTTNPNKLIKLELEKWYEFHTYETFAKYIKQKYDNNPILLNNDYNHSIVICDEAHNLFVDEEEPDRDNEPIEKSGWNKEKTYNYLWYFYHNINYCKKIIATATPMLNSVDEMGKIMNLILPLNLQMPTAENLKYKKNIEELYINMKLTEINNFFKGRITYVRAFDTGAVRMDQTNKLVKCQNCPKEFNVYLTRMSEFQTKMYSNIYDVKGGSAYSLFLNNASNFVFPDGSIDEPENQIIDKLSSTKINNIKKEAMKNIVNYPKSAINKNEEISSSEEEQKKSKKKGKDNIKQGYDKYVIEISTKKKKINPELNIERKKSQILYKINTEAKPPLLLNTIEDVKKYSCKYAAIINALNNDEGSSFIYGRYNKSSGNIMLALCMENVGGYERYMETSSIFVKSDDGIERIKDNFIKKPRYALLTSETIKNDAAYNSIMETMNSYENRHGEYLKCVIASRVARDGLNFKNITSIHIVGPEYNISSMYQAVSRGIRTASHKDLLDELITQNFKPKIDIKVYMHAAIPNKKFFNNNIGVDLHIYEIAHRKQININHILMEGKQCSIGCQINIKRNIRQNDLIKYNCVSPTYTDIDYSTYNAYYLDEDILNIYPKIVKEISIMNSFVLTELYDKFIYTKDIILTVLEYIILNKIQIIDKFGFITYLYYDNGTYYLDKSYNNTHSSSSYIIYTNNLIGIENNTDNYIEKINEDSYNNFLKLTDMQDIQKTFEHLNVDIQINIIEQQYINPSPQYKFIIDKYNKFFYTIKKFITDVNIPLVKEVKTKGRPKKTIIKGLCPENIIKTKENVILNTLYLLKNTNKHNFINFYMSANTKIRIYDETENIGWRDCTDCESELYTQEIKTINNTHFNNLKIKYDNLFGIVLPNDMLIVYDKPEKNTKTQKENMGISRNKSRGRVCNSYDVPTLEEIAKILKIKNYSEYKQKDLCPIIEKTLINTNRVF